MKKVLFIVPDIQKSILITCFGGISPNSPNYHSSIPGKKNRKKKKEKKKSTLVMKVLYTVVNQHDIPETTWNSPYR